MPADVIYMPADLIYMPADLLYMPADHIYMPANLVNMPYPKIYKISQAQRIQFIIFMIKVRALVRLKSIAFGGIRPSDVAP